MFENNNKLVTKRAKGLQQNENSVAVPFIFKYMPNISLQYYKSVFPNFFFLVR